MEILNKTPELKYLLLLLPLFFVFDLTYYCAFFVLLLFALFLVDKSGNGLGSIHISDFVVWLLLIFWGAYQVIVSFDSGTAFYYFFVIILVPFMLFILITNLELDISFLDVFFKLLFLSGVILALYSLYILYQKNFEFTSRVPSLWTHYNLVAGYLMMLLFFNLTFVTNSKFSVKMFPYYASFLMTLFALLATQTRGIWMATAAGMLFYVVRRPRLIVPAAGLAAGIMILFYEIVVDRVLSVVNFIYDVSSIGRLQAWIASALLIKENPLFGYGFDSFRYLRDKIFVVYYVILPHPHNTFLTLALDLGIIGMVLYLFFFFKAFYYSVKLKRKHTDHSIVKYLEGIQLTCVGFLVAFMFEPYFTILGAITIALWMIISISYFFWNESIHKEPQGAQLSP